MDFRSIPRDPHAFQQPVTAEDIQAIGQRALGDAARVASAVELGGGMYNTTYRITVDSMETPVILRIAPAPEQQFSSERELMRNEAATVPYLSPIASLVLRVLFADWSQEITGRDWIMQSHLTGVPAPEHLGSYPAISGLAFSPSSATSRHAFTPSVAVAGEQPCWPAAVVGRSHGDGIPSL
ncbi:phosphotransferase family protein [Streptomyces sp. NPDC004561]